ncbi:sulfotransferase [uncultured Pelagimonas sp.]|uniref:sulfotransferase family protein n=1 Tax=uncultured Pelagimonas sp. TaxID=1618102 RepID=UPI00262E0FD9|nr:sulfotransferase [uncultured Pelagimonas sp.]
MTQSTIWSRASRANQRLGLYTPSLKEFCFLIGAMKSGTTTLYHYLAQHPAIAENQYQKEPEFFSSPHEPDDLAPYYRQWLPRLMGRQIALDGSTGYSKQPGFPDVAKRLSKLPGRKHFVYMLRNPVDRLESHLAHNLAAKEVVFEPGAELPDLTHPLAVSQYAYQLDAYRAAFPDIAVKIVAFEAFKTDPLAVVRDICAHLEIDPDFAFEVLPPQNTRSKRADVQSFKLTSDQRADITKRLQPDLERLHAQYGFDTGIWGLS